MDYGEYKARRLRNEERMAVMTLDMLSRSFAYQIEQLEGRLKHVKYLKRDKALVGKICMKLVTAALEGSPPDIAAHIIRQSRDFRFGLERISPVRKKEEVVMPLDDEWQFIHICLDSRCAICLKTPGEAQACKVRQLLRRYADEPDPMSAGECGFMGHDLGDSQKLNKQERL